MTNIVPLFFSLFRISSLSCANTSIPLILLGIYYGFLITLPLGPSQIVCIRTFLLESNGLENTLFSTVQKNRAVIAAISGLFVAQLFFILSIYWPPLYMIWDRPHMLTLLVVPYMFFYWSRSWQFDSIQFTQIKHPFLSGKVQGAFLDSLLFQLLNPALLPNAALIRLMNLFLFRYSQSFSFVIGGIIGWLGGQVAFVLLMYLLVLRLERDTHTVYLVLKRLVHKFFPPILFAICLAYLTKAPLPFLSKKIVESNAESFQYLKPWPSLAFDTTTWNRPLRLRPEYIIRKLQDQITTFEKDHKDHAMQNSKEIGKMQDEILKMQDFLATVAKNYPMQNSKEVLKMQYEIRKLQDQITTFDNLIQESKEKEENEENKEKEENEENKENDVIPEDVIQTYNKKRLSQYFFTNCISDGKRRLAHTYPESLDKLRNDLEICLNMPSISEQDDNSIYVEWMNAKLNRRKKLYNILASKMKELDKGCTVESVIHQQLASWTFLKECVNKYLDPRLVTYIRGRSLPNESKPVWKKIEIDSSRSGEVNRQSILDSSNVFHTNKLKDWISRKLKEVDENSFIPWENMNIDSYENLKLLLDKQNTNGLISDTDNLSWQTFINLYKQKQKIAEFKNANDKITTADKKLVVVSNWRDLWLCLQYLFSVNIPWLPKAFKLNRIGNNKQIQVLREIQKDMPFWRIDQNIHIKTTKKAEENNKQPDLPKMGTRYIKGVLLSRKRRSTLWNLERFPFQTPVLWEHKIRNKYNKTFQSPKKSLMNWKKQEIGGFNTSRSSLSTRQTQIFTYLQGVRGPILLLQSVFRKYIKLPLLIILKNSMRLLLFQQPEFEQDFQDWSREVYIYTSYDGYKDRSLSFFKLPNEWWKEGLQIQIVYPFDLRPWRSSVGNNQDFHNQQSDIKLSTKSAYLSLLGTEIKKPNSHLIRLKPYFWKPVFKASGLVLYKRCLAIFKKYFAFVAFPFQLIKGYLVYFDSQPKITSSSSYRQHDAVKELYESPTSSRVNTKVEIDKLFQEASSRELENLLQKSDSQLLQHKSLQKSFYKIPTLDNKLLIQNRFFEMLPTKKEHSVVSTKFLSEPSYFSIRYKLLQVNSFFIQIKRKILYAQKLSTNRCKDLGIFFKKKTRHAITHFVQIITKTKRILNYLQIKIRRISGFLLQQIANRMLPKSAKVLKLEKLNYTYPITQAYLLHKIWQTRLVNNLYLTSIWKDWKNSKNGLQQNVQSFLVTQGTFAKDPTTLNLNIWNYWVQSIPCYTPLSDIWLNIVPDLWRSAVKSKMQYNEVVSDTNFQLDKENLQSDLIYHQPLFDKTNKLLKRIFWNQIYLRCTDLLYDNVYYLPEKRKLISTQFSQNIDNMNADQTSVLSTNELEENNLASETTEWGFTRARQGRLAPNLTSFQSTIQQIEAKTVNKKLLNTSTLDFQKQEKTFTENSANSSEKQVSCFSLLSITKLDKLESGSMNPKLLYGYMQLLNVLARISVYDSNLEDQRSSMLVLLADLEYEIHPLFAPQESDLNLLRPEISTPQIVNWRTKVINDHMLMYNIVAPILKHTDSIHNKEFDNLPSALLPKSNPQRSAFLIASLTPEDAFLPNITRELRVLEHLNLAETTYLNTNVSLSSVDSSKQSLNINNQFTHNYVMKRFLWPTHRLEDLACMNRFWFGVGNYSRFAALRIGMYPSFTQ